MREVRAHIGLAAVFALLLALGAYQGATLKHLRESERFYRWMASVTEDVFISGRDTEGGGAESLYLPQVATETAVSGMASVSTAPGAAALAAGLNESLLAAARDAAMKAGKPKDYALFEGIAAEVQAALGGPAGVRLADSRLVTLLRDGDPDNRIWALARSASLAPQRAAFMEHLRAQRLEFARDVDVAEAQSSGVNLFNLFFGFRKIAANFVWLQVDKYWHMGMTHRMLPLMKTTVMLDPHFVDAYLVGAWHLAYNITAGMGETKPQDKVWLPEHNVLAGERERYYYMAIDYYNDGIRNNPREYKLHFEAGFCVYKNKLNDYRNAIKHLTRATRLPHERWVPRQLYICQELNGQYEDALLGWQDYSKRFPENTVAPRFIKRNEGLLSESQGDRLMAEARAAKDPTTTQELRQRAFQKYEDAKKIYSQMNEAFSDGRIVRIEAIRLAEEGRYLEAIALLEHARWQSAAFWDESSQMIMDYKQRAGVPLSQSEKKALLRKEDEAERLRTIRARELDEQAREGSAQ